MRYARNIYRLFALAAVLGLVAWGCSTDSPTAPRQTPPPPAPPGQSFSIDLGSDPRGIPIDPELFTGLENVTVVLEVNPFPPDGTSILVTTNIGQFDPLLPIRDLGLVLRNGTAFFTLYAGLPLQLGIATVQATLEEGSGEIDIPIAFLFANFSCSNPDANVSVDFVNTSSFDATGFAWDFGDGNTSDERSPEHVYDEPGQYFVNLTVSKTLGQIVLETSVLKPVDTANTECG